MLSLDQSHLGLEVLGVGGGGEGDPWPPSSSATIHTSYSVSPASLGTPCSLWMTRSFGVVSVDGVSDVGVCAGDGRSRTPWG